MFLPYDIEKVVFHSAIGDSVDLGSIKVVKELLIKNQDKVSCELYYKSDFHVYQTIPDDVFLYLI